MTAETVTIGLAQISPVWLNRAATIEKVSQYVRKAAEQGCDLVCFGEALIPGYPFWVELTEGARFESTTQKTLYAHYLREAVQPADLMPICEVARLQQIAVIVGTIERAADRGGHSCYCSLVYIDKAGTIRNIHRKLQPTYEERLVWAPGDGQGLQTFPFGAFTLGALNCWENWMPLPRAALYGQGEDLHVAIWPGGLHNTQDITRFIAREARSIVVSVSGLMRKSDIPDDVPFADEIRRAAKDYLANGGSAVAGPDGNWILEPQVGEEALYVVTVDHAFVRRERQNFDPVGHYSRPDVTQLLVNRTRQTTVRFVDSE